MGVAVPPAPFEIAWHGRPDDATGPFRIYPAELVGLLPAGWLKGKIALVGAVLADTDRHRTPLSVLGQNTPGVEIQAHVLVATARATVVNARLSAGPRPTSALSLGLALVGGLLGQPRRGSASLAQLGAAFLVPLAMLGLAAWHVRGGRTARLAAGPRRLAGDQCRRRRRRVPGTSGPSGASAELFARHVSTPIADQIWRERRTFIAGGRPKPQELTATVLFSDIEGFSTAPRSWGQPADELARGLHGAMVGIVTDHRGIVLQFIGEGCCAAYGVPVARTGPRRSRRTRGRPPARPSPWRTR